MGHDTFGSDKTNFTITIEDSGIGGLKNELTHTLGTIARSDITVFMEAMAAGDIRRRPATAHDRPPAIAAGRQQY